MRRYFYRIFRSSDRNWRRRLQAFPPSTSAKPPSQTDVFLRRQVFRQIFKHGLPLILAGVFLLILIHQLDHLDPSAVLALTRSVTPEQWLFALIFTAISFIAVGRYDAVVHHMLGTHVPAHRASRAGIAAIAISQTTGFGLITGALARWRMLPEISIWQATRLTAIVAATFLSGWAVCAALSLITVYTFFPDIVRNLPWMAGPVLFAGGLISIGCLIASVLQPQHIYLPSPVHSILQVFNVNQSRLIALPAFPPLTVLAKILGLTLVDTVTACAALWVLLPAGADPGFALLLPAFLLAFGLGLICGSPAGIGPFEVALFAFLPFVADAPLMAGILAWRLVYYIVPAVLGIIALAVGQRSTSPIGDTSLSTSPKQHMPQVTLIENSAFSEAGLANQDQLRITCAPGAGVAFLTGETGQTLTALRTPLALPSSDVALQVLTRSARVRDKVPCLYKTSARMAASARKRDWKTIKIAEEAWLCPATFDLDTPARRGLRRKLRKAGKSRVEIRHADALSVRELREIENLNTQWAAQHGGERGFSMGRFCPDYLKNQHIFIARQDNQIVGFTSFHSNRSEWALDLMRHSPNCPDGAMHALIHCALIRAARAGVPRLSLAAVPPCQTEIAAETRYPASLIRLLASKLQGRGLRQFKLAFAPERTPLYMAAPGWVSLLVSAFDIYLAIVWPPKIPTPKPEKDILPDGHFTSQTPYAFAQLPVVKDERAS